MALTGVTLFKRLMRRAVRRASNGLVPPGKVWHLPKSKCYGDSKMTGNIDNDRYFVAQDANNISGTLQRFKESGTESYEAQKRLTNLLAQRLYEDDDCLKSRASDGKAEYRGVHGWNIPSDIPVTRLGASDLSEMHSELADELLPRDGSKYSTPDRQDGMFFRVPVVDGEPIDLDVSDDADYHAVKGQLENWFEQTEPVVADGGGRFGKAQEQAKNGEEPVNDDDQPEDQDSDLTPAEQALTGAEHIGEATAPGVLRFLNNNPEAIDTILGELESVESYETAEVDRLAEVAGEERAEALRELFPDKSDEALVAFEQG